MKFKYSSFIVSFVSFTLLLIHLIFPEIKIDITTLFLLIIALIPYLLPFLKSLELPGGVKIELKDAKAATDKVTLNLYDTLHVSDEIETIHERDGKIINDPIPYLKIIASTDSNLALVGFRIEIERRIRSISTIKDINENQPLSRIVRILQSKNILPIQVSSGLLELISLGNQAAHGANVSTEAVNWVLDVGPSILNILDKYIESN